MTTVTCDHFRELISARADAELAVDDEQRLDIHLGSCAACTRYQDDVFSLLRRLRLTAAPSAATRDARPLTIDAVASVQVVSLMRWALFVIGTTLLVLHARTIVAADTTLASHVSRHGGVFGTALGIAMLAVAAKPHRAIGLVPMTSAVAILMTVVAVVDLIARHTTVMTEAIHVVEFGGLVCLWVISGGPSRLHRRAEVLGAAATASHH